MRESSTVWSDLLIETGAMQTGHFLLSSGRHSDRYIQCAKVLEHPANAARLGAALAEGIDADRVDRVVSPPLGGILIGYEVARHLGKPFFFPERGPDGLFQLRRGFTLEPGERLCLVEDVITTGRTTRELLNLLAGMGAIPTVVAGIVDRSVDHTINEFEIHSLLRIEIPTYERDECPLCKDGVELTQPGSRKSPEKGER